MHPRIEERRRLVSYCRWMRLRYSTSARAEDSPPSAPDNGGQSEIEKPIRRIVDGGIIGTDPDRSAKVECPLCTPKRTIG